MKQKKRGFTLMEVLIVVLIVAILSAIAVPQYQKAVLKSRFSSLMPTTQAIRDGNEIYYMTNGRYADAVGKLDVTATNADDMTLTVSDDPDYAYTMATRPSIHNNLIMYQKHSTNFPGEIHCEALTGNTQAEWLCETGMHAVKSIGEVITEGYDTYVLEGTGAGFPPGYSALLASVSCDAALSAGFTCESSLNEDGTARKKVCTDTFCLYTDRAEDGSYKLTSCVVQTNGKCYVNRENQYDEEGNRVQRVVCRDNSSDGSCRRASVDEFTYDKDGNMLTYSNCGSNISVPVSSCDSYTSGTKYEYDEYGHKTTEYQCSNFSGTTCTAYQANYEEEKVYDKDGNVLSVRRCQSRDNTGKCTAYSGSGYEYTYDSNGKTVRSCSTRDSNGNCTSYSTSNAGKYVNDYDENGKLKSIAYFTCNNMSESGTCSKYSRGMNSLEKYDSNGNKTAKFTCDWQSTQTTCDYKNATFYTYDSNGNMTSKRDCASRAINQDATACTSYDSYGEHMQYTYDTNGNMLSSRRCTGGGDSVDCSPRSGDYFYKYNEQNQLVSRAWCGNVQDGQCTSYNITDYVYDEAGQSMGTRSCNSSSNQVDLETRTCITFQYDTGTLEPPSLPVTVQ